MDPLRLPAMQFDAYKVKKAFSCAVLWIRIRILFLVGRIRIQEGKMTHESEEISGLSAVCDFVEE
jgi:hypothetical protein